MIYSKAKASFDALLKNAPSGLVGTLRLGIRSTNATQVTAQSTAAITEAAGGDYVGVRTAPEDEGTYVVVWDHGNPEDPEEDAVELLQVSRVQPFASVVPFLPEPADVAALLRARTYNDESQQEGEFSEDTRPTAIQVATLINGSANEVAARIGQEVEDDGLRAYARNVVALRAAMTVELSYFPEQNDEDRSTIYKELKALYEEGLSFLINALPDTEATQKGLYSLRTRSEVSGVFPTSELLP